MGNSVAPYLGFGSLRPVLDLLNVAMLAGLMTVGSTMTLTQDTVLAAKAASMAGRMSCGRST